MPGINGNPLGLVTPGDPLVFPAEVFNGSIECIKDLRARQLSGGAGDLFDPLASGLVIAKNSTTVDLPRWGVLGFDTPLFIPGSDGIDQTFVSRNPINGVAPTYADHYGRFLVAVEPIAAGTVGRCLHRAMLACQITVVTATDDFADTPAWTSSGDAKLLRSGPTGAARILWKESGTGTKYAIVAFDLACQRQLWIPARISARSSTTVAAPSTINYGASAIDRAVSVSAKVPKYGRPSRGDDWMIYPCAVGDACHIVLTPDGTGSYAADLAVYTEAIWPAADCPS